MDQSFNGKKLGYHCKKKLKACTEKTKLRKNRISKLPDDILIHILSLLPLKEAVSTSVLSKRWRHLWAHLPSIIIGSPNTPTCFSRRKAEERRCVQWIDQLVNSYKAPILDEFSINAEFRRSHYGSMISWLRFAMEKRVKRLALGIGSSCSFTFPSSLSFSSLSSITLAEVHVTGKVLEKLLYDCQTLESISVLYSNSLVALKVAGPSLNLKSLEIKFCFRLKILEVSAPNLISFSYNGKPLRLHLESFPKLADVYIGGYYATYWISNSLDPKSLDLWNCISEIEVLTIEAFEELQSIVQVFPVFSRLKKLHLTISPSSDVVLFGVGSLIQACLSLREFVLQLDYTYEEVKRTKHTRNLAKPCPHYNLKTLEIVGFTGWKVDLAFAKYLIESAVSLEKLIVEPTAQASLYELCSKVREARARKQAKKLLPHLQFGTEFQIRDPQHRY